MRFKENFLVRPSKASKSGLVSVECCITIDGKRLYQRLPRQIKPSQWDNKRNEVKGKSEEVAEINNFIQVYKQNLYSIHSKIIELNLPYNVETFKNGLNGKLENHKNKTLIDLYEDFNKEYFTLKESNQIAGTTYQKHNTTLNYLKSYLKSKYDKNDILLLDVNKSFVEGFYLYLRGTKNLQNNSAVNYMKKLKRVINIAINDGIIQKNPFANYQLHLENVNINFLTIEEIKTIYNKKITNERLNKVKDIYIFACFSGMSYGDCKTFDYNQHVTKDEQGNEFIMKKRNKTDVLATIPLLPIPKEILEKYNYKLPVPSNQKVNEYLKEIRIICNIEKELHFHVARHIDNSFQLKTSILQEQNS